MKIKSITKVIPERVYAIQTSTGTFISDGIAHHNCYVCNIRKHGNQLTYYRFMVKKYGEKEVERLERLSKTARPFLARELELIIEHYRPPYPLPPIE